MTAISSTGVRDTKAFGFNPVPLEYNDAIAPVKASVNCRQGGIACINSGYYAPLTAALGLRAMGIFQQSFDNTNGSNASADSAGVPGARVKSGVFFMASGTSADVVNQAAIGSVVYGIDDQTVGLTDGGGTRSPVGICVGYDSVLGLPAIAIGPQFIPTTALVYANPKIQVIAGGSGTTLASGTKAVAAASFSLTSSSIIIPIVTAANSSTAFGVNYVFSSITTGIAGTAAFTVTSKKADTTTETGDLSTLSFLIIN